MQTPFDSQVKADLTLKPTSSPRDQSLNDLLYNNNNNNNNNKIYIYKKHQTELDMKK